MYEHGKEIIRLPRIKSIEDIKLRSIVDGNECWIWSLSKTLLGYGQSFSKRENRAVMAHRLSYELATGNFIPKDKEIDHTCNVRACVNPEHLQAVTRQENLKRRDKSKAHCKQGHPWISENIYVFAHGKVCKMCAKNRQKQWHKAHPEANKAYRKKQYENEQHKDVAK